MQMEQALWAQGVRWVAGLDEAGRGALAGPVVAAAVVVRQATCDVWGAVRDSKLLSPAQRSGPQQSKPRRQRGGLGWWMRL